VYLGFRPKYILFKNIFDSAQGWYVYDSVRSTYNVIGEELNPNTSGAAFNRIPALDFLSNGFKLRTTDSVVNSASNFIYMAFAENPTKYSLAR
jgi:hypothetical protein